MIAIYTCAYNSSVTLKRCVESILNQTYKDWIYYLVDNGSDKDNTREMLLEYSQKNSKIIPILLDKNDPLKALNICFSRIKESNADYFCSLDSDDEYFPDFFEKALDFAKENSLDIACCGSEMVNMDTFEVMNYRKVEKNIFMNTPEEVNKNFKDFFHNSLMPIWGKLFKTDLLNKFDVCDTNWEFYKLSYNIDVIFDLKLAEYTEHIGFLAGVEHKYYIPSTVGQTSSFTYNPTRLDAVKILRNRAAEFLIKKVGYLSKYNECVLNHHFLHQTQFTLNLMVFSDIDPDEKLRVMRNVLTDKFTLTVLENKNINDERKEFFYRSMLDWVASLKDADSKEDGIWLGMTLSSLLRSKKEYAIWSLCNIEYLIKNEKFEEADRELTDWEQILPDLPTIKKFRDKLDTVMPKCK